MKKKLLSALLAVAMVGTMLAGCGSKEASSTGGSTATTAGAKDGQWLLAGNTWGTGAYPLDIIVTQEKYFSEQFDVALDVVNNEFTADKVVTQLESQMANDPDGVLFLGIAASTFKPVVDICEQQKKPYTFNDNLPEEQVLNQCLAGDYFCGAIAAAPYDMGYNIGEMAAKDGKKSAVITAAAMGDYSHDSRIEGFTDAFEKAGGKVLQVAHSADPSEATSKTNDLMSANPDADCIYATGGDYIVAAITVLDQRSELKTDLYGTDIDPSILEAIESGKCVATNGGQFVAGSLAETLLINYLEGHQILDKDGKAPVFNNLSTFIVNKDNIDKIKPLFDANESLISNKTYEKLLYKYNPDVDYDTYNEVFEGYADSVYELAGITE